MKGWGPVAPRWYSYFLTCVRRRKWLRLMVYLPSLVTSDSKGVFHPPSHIPSASEPTSPFPTGSSSADLTTGKLASSSPMSSKNYKGPEFDVLEIWRGNEHDWSRCHTALKTLHSDGRRLELWKSWIGDQGDQEEDILAMVRLSNERKGVCWTEDQNMTVKSEQVPISQIIADEPLNVDSSRAPRAFLAKVLSEHVSSVLSPSTAIDRSDIPSRRLKRFSRYLFIQIRVPSSMTCSEDRISWRSCRPQYRSLSQPTSGRDWNYSII